MYYYTTRSLSSIWVAYDCNAGNFCKQLKHIIAFYAHDFWAGEYVLDRQSAEYANGAKYLVHWQPLECSC